MQACEDGLKGLEQRGYVVWRVVGFSAIDQGRNQLATDALAEGFDETMWIDSDGAVFPADGQPDAGGILVSGRGLCVFERARQCGFNVMADTTVRLWHYGQYGYAWEDAGVDRPRHATFTLNFGDSPAR